MKPIDKVVKPQKTSTLPRCEHCYITIAGGAYYDCDLQKDGVASRRRCTREDSKRCPLVEANCPECGHELPCLREFTKELTCYLMFVDQKGMVSYEPDSAYEPEPLDEGFEYACPNCGVFITKDPEAAKKLLMRKWATESGDTQPPTPSGEVKVGNS